MTLPDPSPCVVAVSLSPGHHFSKGTALSITLIEGIGVEGDAHAGMTVKHRSRVAVDPTQPNLRQVHLIALETIADLQARGFRVAPGVMGENITTRGISVFDLPRGTRLKLGRDAVVEVTGLRNPCSQLDAFQHGLTAAVLGRSASGELMLKAGIMGVVLCGGIVRPDDSITIELPAEPHQKLLRV